MKWCEVKRSLTHAAAAATGLMEGACLSQRALCKRTCSRLWDSLVVDCNFPNCSSTFISTQCKTHQFPTKYSYGLYTVYVSWALSMEEEFTSRLTDSVDSGFDHTPTECSFNDRAAYCSSRLSCFLPSLRSPAMGHWGTCSLDFQLFNFFLVTSVLRKLWHSTPCGCLPRKNILAYSFVTVYCMNFIIFLCVTLKLFSLSFVPLLAPNPGDAIVCHCNHFSVNAET